MATVEGTMLASYNRGMKVIRESGGVKTTVSAESMQRAPLFIFNDAREARDFQVWLRANFEVIKEQAESTTSVGKLLELENYHTHNFVACRFDYSTGDAAGQNMTSRATFFACEWIRKNYPGALKNYMLSGNWDTEKKTSAVNMLKGRGRRVTAEVTIPRKVLMDNLRITPEQMQYGYQITTLSALTTSSSNNASHPANGLAALYAATGQDLANIGESNQCTVYQRMTREGDHYFSITLPSIIMASYGGGTNLPTQRECLEMMDCFGKDSHSLPQPGSIKQRGPTNGLMRTSVWVGIAKLQNCSLSRPRKTPAFLWLSLGLAMWSVSLYVLPHDSNQPNYKRTPRTRQVQHW